MSDLFGKAYKNFLSLVDEYNLIPEDRKKVVIFYSGGKDASLAIDLFLEYKNKKKKELEINLLTVRFPKMIYDSDDVQQQNFVKDAVKYWKSKGCKHMWVETPEGIGDHLFEDMDTPCQVCESTKTKIIAEELSKEKYKDSLICMAHTAEDLAGYLSEIFYIGGKYKHWKNIHENNPDLFNRFIQLVKRVHPKYSPGTFGTNITYIKPLLNMEEDLIRDIKRERNYPNIPECCEEVRGDKFKMYKRIVMEGIDWLRNRYDQNSKIYTNFLFNDYKVMIERYKDLGLIPDVKEIEKLKLKSGI